MKRQMPVFMDKGGTYMTIIYEKEQLSEIIAAVQAGQTIAFPTDTVYGLGVISTDAQALERLKAAKGRPDSKPIPTMVASVEQLRTVACVDERAEKIAEEFLPGALTMVMKRQADLPEYMTNGWETIGVRMPDDAFVLALIAGCGAPMLVSSANRSGEATGTTFEEVMRQLDGRIDGIVKGTCGCMSASTIIDLSQDEVKVLREGPITKAQIEEALAR